jgi:hypothetical protein
MKPNVSKLIPVLIFLLLIVSSCKKKNDGTLTFNHRIISMSEFYNNILDYKTTIEYSNDKISKAISTSYNSGVVSSTETLVFTYPDGNTIHASGSSSGSQTYTTTIDITLSNNKPAQSISDYGTDKNKTVFTYNSDGKINKISVYYYTTTWILSSESTYIYSSGKLVQISDVEYSGTSTYESKYVYSFSGNDVNEAIYSSKQTGGTWTESSKNVYTYTAGNISKITDYYKSGTTWTLSSTHDFTYDSDNNLIKEASGNTSRTEYTYQDGGGNFLLIMEATGGNSSFYPTPHKKSKMLKGTFGKMF